MGKIKIGGMVIGAVQTNCYFAYREGEKDCIVFDAPDTGKEIVRRIEGAGLHVRALLLTSWVHRIFVHRHLHLQRAEERMRLRSMRLLPRKICFPILPLT